MQVPYMAHDVRPIVELSVMEDAWSVGHNNTTCIEPYHENIEGMQTLWFAIYKGEYIAYRVPVSAVQYVYYGKAEAGKEA